MRWIYCYALVGLIPLVGCQLPGERSRCGWHFEILKAPVIDTNGTVLIQTGQPVVGAHPMGSVQGPIQEGQFQHGPAQPAPALPIQPKLMNRLMPTIQADPCAPRGALTVEEWCRIQEATQAKKLPQPH